MAERTSTYYEIDDRAARAAHDANSMRAFRSDAPDYREQVDEAYELAGTVAERFPERAEKAYGLADAYARRLAGWYNEGYRIEGMCPSVLVAGPANFPVRRKERQNAARDRHWEAYKAVEGVKGKLRRMAAGRDAIQAGDADAADRLRAKIDAMEAAQRMMKAANAYYRKHKTLAGCPDMTEVQIREAEAGMSAEWNLYKDVPFAPYRLANNRQNLAAARKRLAAIDGAKERGSSEREIEIAGEAVKVVENAETMRLQLVFDGKPGEDVRRELKAHGFRWAPKSGAWQRQLTGNARLALRQVAERLSA